MGYLRIRHCHSALLLFLLTIAGAFSYQFGLPHPLGWSLPQPAHIANFLPLGLTVSLAVFLRSRWSPLYERAITTHSTVFPRLVVCLGAALALGLILSIMFFRAALPTLIQLVTVNGIAAIGIACFFSAARSPLVNFALPCALMLCLCSCAWVPEMFPYIGDPIGIGAPILVRILLLGLGSIGMLLYIYRGRQGASV